MKRLLFGLFLIVAGILLTLENLGYLKHSDWEVLSKFWPLALIVIGVALLTRGHVLGRILTLLIFLFALGFVLLTSLIF